MKVIITIITSLVLSLGLVAPAAADEWGSVPVVHTTYTADPPVIVGSPCEEYVALAGVLNEMLVIEKANVAQANDSVERLVRIANRRQAKIYELRAIIRQLRRS